MPWSPKQHRLFCARCSNRKGAADYCRMCHEGIKSGSSQQKTDWRKEAAKQR
jgi:hypothetical protein